MKRKCPNPKCSAQNSTQFVRKDGHYYRRGDSRKVQRYTCRACGKKFSSATGSPAFRQRKRRLNSQIAKLLTSNVSIRTTAKILGLHQDTVARRMNYLANRARIKQEALIKKQASQFKKRQLDDLVTKEKSKLFISDPTGSR